ncbi:MAG: hypothetical protein IPK86_03230 [Neisseriales bacterium]|nr:MAG: hypothetical protein IPK86_03230 [Neisseriales bacterium]
MAFGEIDELLEPVAHFFGLKKRKLIGFEAMLAWLSLQEKQDEARIKAYQAIQSGDDLKPNQIHPYEATLRTDSIMVDTECAKFHVGAIKQYFGDLQHLSALLKSGLYSELSHAAPEDLEGKIRSWVAQNQAEVDRIVKKYQETKKDLEVFKGANGISVSAIYSDRKNALYWLVFFGIAEALFNAFFLRQGINFLTFLFVAFGIAALNIVSNTVFGFAYRIKNHINKRKAKRGAWYLIFSILAILIINGIIAFYRYRYISANEGFNDAFWLESMVLFLIGISMGIAAFQKGYQLDDPYPGYGHYARMFDKWSKRLAEAQNARGVYCTDLKQRADLDLDNLGMRILSTYDDFNGNLPEIAREIKAWEEDRKQVDFAYQQLQEIFKITISAHQPNGTDDYPQKIQSLSENTQLESYKTQLEDFIKNKEGIHQQAQTLQKSILSQKKSLQVWWQKSDITDLLNFPKMPEDKKHGSKKVAQANAEDEYILN